MIPTATLRDIDADTVIAEMKTQKNKLSVWVIHNEDDLNDAFVALASNGDSLSTIDAVKIDEKDLESLNFDDEMGDTPTYRINDKHRNITELNYESMGVVLSSIIEGIKRSNNIRMTKPKLRELLVNAYKDEKLNIDDMSPQIVGEIEKALRANIH